MKYCQSRYSGRNSKSFLRVHPIVGSSNTAKRYISIGSARIVILDVEICHNTGFGPVRKSILLSHCHRDFIGKPFRIAIGIFCYRHLRATGAVLAGNRIRKGRRIRAPGVFLPAVWRGASRFDGRVSEEVCLLRADRYCH